MEYKNFIETEKINRMDYKLDSRDPTYGTSLRKGG
jgi:hypothetical protein